MAKVRMGNIINFFLSGIEMKLSKEGLELVARSRKYLIYYDHVQGRFIKIPRLRNRVLMHMTISSYVNSCS